VYVSVVLCPYQALAFAYDLIAGLAYTAVSVMTARYAEKRNDSPCKIGVNAHYSSTIGQWCAYTVVYT
jgi:hypothetical protein